MNQFSQQKAKTKVENKPMDSSNFGNDYRNNIDNCDFKPIYKEIEDDSCIQKHTSLHFNNDYKDFASPETIKQQIEQGCNSEIMKIQIDDPCFDAKKYCTIQPPPSKKRKWMT